MVAVYIGIAIQIADDSPLAPLSLSLFLVGGTFILAGILHPQEFKCLPMGLVYMIMIPSMYLFLVIYSIFNLHVVSWGTREVKQDAKQSEEGAYKAKTPESKQKGTIWDRITGGSSKLGFFVPIEEGIRADLKKINSRLDKLDGKLEKALKIESNKVPEISKEEETHATENKSSAQSTIQNETRCHTKSDVMVDPFWDTKSGPVGKLPEDEITFWEDMIDTYLKPLKKDVKKEEQQKQGSIPDAISQQSRIVKLTDSGSGNP